MTLMPNEERKTLVLTGASRGIGHATVKRFSSAGWRVISCSRQPFPEDCPWEAGPEDHIQVDLADPTAPIDAVAEIKDRLTAQGVQARMRWSTTPRSRRRGRAAAGSSSLDTRIEDWSTVFQVNFFAAIMLARGLIEELEAASGAVVNVTSIAGGRVHPFAGSAYATSKAALAASPARWPPTSRPLGIRVNAISPGEIDTAILSPGTEALVADIPMRRIGLPEEVAKVIYFLCTDQSSYINGAELHINGGQHV